MATVRTLYGTAVLDARIYVLGGQDSTIETLSSVEVFDPATNSWSPGPSLRAPRAETAAAAVHGTLFLIGGFVGVFPISSTLNEALTP
jgi:hypothetical protein